jgi:hypothetical protein
MRFRLLRRRRWLDELGPGEPCADVEQQQHVAERRLRGLIADGLESGDGRPATADVIDEICQRAFAADT